jgi:hypothetical protein
MKPAVLKDKFADSPPCRKPTESHSQQRDSDNFRFLDCPVFVLAPALVTALPATRRVLRA